MKHLILFAFTSLVLMTTGCLGGGGGGDSEFVGAAQISLRTSPGTIDTRDRTQVRINISKVIDTGIILKIRYSNKLNYAINTSKLKIESEDEGTSVAPAHNVTNDGTTYLVYFLPRSAFGDSESDEDMSEKGTLTLELIGTDRLRDGIIEADADVNDPTISDDVEFDINSPAFEGETEASITVNESRS